LTTQVAAGPARPRTEPHQGSTCSPATSSRPTRSSSRPSETKRPSPSGRRRRPDPRRPALPGGPDEPHRPRPPRLWTFIQSVTGMLTAGAIFDLDLGVLHAVARRRDRRRPRRPQGIRTDAAAADGPHPQVRLGSRPAPRGKPVPIPTPCPPPVPPPLRHTRRRGRRPSATSNGSTRDTRGWNDIAYTWLYSPATACSSRAAAPASPAPTHEGTTKTLTPSASSATTRCPDRPPTSSRTSHSLGSHGTAPAYGPNRYMGHQDVGATLCPGQHLYAMIRDINLYAEADMAPSPTPPVAQLPPTLRLGSTGDDVKLLQSASCPTTASSAADPRRGLKRTSNATASPSTASADRRRGGLSSRA
jgi:hypothetical protein